MDAGTGNNGGNVDGGSDGGGATGGTSTDGGSSGTSAGEDCARLRAASDPGAATASHFIWLRDSRGVDTCSPAVASGTGGLALTMNGYHSQTIDPTHRQWAVPGARPRLESANRLSRDGLIRSSSVVAGSPERSPAHGTRRKRICRSACRRAGRAGLRPGRRGRQPVGEELWNDAFPRCKRILPDGTDYGGLRRQRDPTRARPRSRPPGVHDVSDPGGPWFASRQSAHAHELYWLPPVSGQLNQTVLPSALCAVSRRYAMAP